METGSAVSLFLLDSDFSNFSQLIHNLLREVPSFNLHLGLFSSSEGNESFDFVFFDQIWSRSGFSMRFVVSRSFFQNFIELERKSLTCFV